MAMYQEREVNEHAFRVSRSWVKWAVIISMISCGKRGRALPSRRLTLINGCNAGYEVDEVDPYHVTVQRSG